MTTQEAPVDSSRYTTTLNPLHQRSVLTGNPKAIGSPAGFLPTNALVSRNDHGLPVGQKRACGKCERRLRIIDHQKIRLPDTTNPKKLVLPFRQLDAGSL
jgi:hypothetical protein